MHNLLISKNILVRCNISNPALYHEFHNPVITNKTTTVQHGAGSIMSVARMTVFVTVFHFLHICMENTALHLKTDK